MWWTSGNGQPGPRDNTGQENIGGACDQDDNDIGGCNGEDVDKVVDDVENKYEFDCEDELDDVVVEPEREPLRRDIELDVSVSNSGGDMSDGDGDVNMSNGDGDMITGDDDVNMSNGDVDMGELTHEASLPLPHRNCWRTSTSTKTSHIFK